MQRIETPCNILCSFAYLNNAQLCQMLIDEVKAKNINLMIDCGAFTKFNAKTAGSHVNLDSYCKFLETMGEYAEKYVMLDVIANAQKSRENYEEMVRRGFEPMFVATMYDNDFAYIADTLKLNPNICVAGGATTKGEWMVKRFQDVYYKTGSKAKIHGLAFVDFPKMFQVPIASVDSSTWSTSQRFGNAMVFNRGLSAYHWTDYLQKGKKMPDELKQTLSMLKITPKMYADPANHRGSQQIELFTSVVAYARFQRYARKNNRDLFLACGNMQQVKNVRWVHDHFNDLSYEEWVKDTKKM